MKLLSLTGLLILITLLAACGGGGAEALTAAQVIESYLQAKVEADSEAMLALSCADWEGPALIESTSFESIDANLEGVSCRLESSQGEQALVACDGQIVAVYGGEATALEVGADLYVLVQEEGAWKMCGYQ